MKESKFFKRVLSLVLVFIMVAMLLPWNVMAATKGEVVTDSSISYTGIQNDTLNQNGTINWPIKIYDYLADGMLFEFAQADGPMQSDNAASTDAYSGQYVLGKAMPFVGTYGTDYTTDRAYTSNAYTSQYLAGRGIRFVRTGVPAVDYSSPKYMRLKLNPSASNSSNVNYYVSHFRNDDGKNVAYSEIRYMVMVYRSSGINTSKTKDYFGAIPSWSDGRLAPMSFLINKVLNTSTTAETNQWIRYEVSNWTNSSEWTYRVFDLQAMGFTSGYTNGLSISPCFNSLNSYLDLSHVGYFTNSTDANNFGKNALDFLSEPGEYVKGTTWNAVDNDAFGFLFSSNGDSWDNGGGAPTANTDVAYYTQSIGYIPPKYVSSTSDPWLKYNTKRYDGKDANGRFNGTGKLIDGNNQIYIVRPSTYYSSTNYQAANPGATSFDLKNLSFDGYTLLTTATKGVFTAGLLEGQLGADGTPQYRQETVEYTADLLSKTLTIPKYGPNGNPNYGYVAGVKNRAQYGYTKDANGKQVANDLAQGLRNCLEIHFTGNARAAAPPMGTYAETLKKADKLKGAFLTVAPNIDTCIDAAYYLLNNLFIANSYNQEQDDFRYLTLSSAKLTDGTDAYVFDGGFSNGAKLSQITSGELTQEKYKELSDSAVEYNGYNLEGGDGTISLNKVDEKDYFYYNSGGYTTLYPFLPVVDAENDPNTGDYSGQTDSYYFAEDGKRNYNTEQNTYYGRNFNYVLASNGEFVYHEEDNLFFEFEGDDDVYLFINGQLVLDLGGGHSVASSALNVNDYVVWARDVLKNPSAYSEAEVARAKALDLENGDIVSFDFYYMERHGYGANMRIATNMHITDPALRIEKTAYQGGKQIEYGGIVDADDPIEYNFKLSNVGNTKLYNLNFDDANIGVSLTPEKGLFVKGDDTATEIDDINGYYVTDARGQRLDAEDLTAVVTGYENVGSGGNYIQSGHTYTRVSDGAGTHIYHEGITINFADNNALKNFLKNLQSEYTDGGTVADEQTQRGAGLWVDADVTFKGIYYTMTEDQEDSGMFDNTVYVSATTKIDPGVSGNETLRSEARHRVYVTAIPSYYQWAGHNLFMSKKRVLDDSSAEAGNESSMLHDYITFFNKVNGDISKFGTEFCDRMGNVVADNYYDYVSIQRAADGAEGYVSSYPESGIYEFFLLMYRYGAPGVPSDISTLKASDMNLGDYAIVRVLVIVADVEDSEYVLDYGLSTENLDAHGELFKNDELYGALSGTQALLMGFTNQEPSYRDFKASSDYNRINFNALNLAENNKIQTEDGYYNVNIAIPENGKVINYDEFSDMYTLTESGTITVNVDCPVAWDDLYLYYWYDDGRNNVWPGEKMNRTSHGNFEMAIPGNVPHVIISNGTSQTVDLHLNVGQETWIDIPGTTNDAGKLYATVEYKTADGIVHVKVPDNWGDVYYYVWDVFNKGLEAWPGDKIETVDEDGYYTFTIPGDITNVVINNGGKGKQTSDLVIYAGSETWITVNNKVVGTNEDMGTTYYGATASRSTETVKMHAKVPSTWEGASLFYWNSNGSATDVDWPGLPMTKGDDGLYHIEGIPADVTNVIINDGKVSNAEQTHNLMISAGIETWFDVSVKSGEGDTTVKAAVPADWSQVNIYFFDGSNPVDGEWPGKAATKLADGTYTIDVPNGATKFIVNNGNNGKESQHILLIRGAENNVIVNNKTVEDNGNVYEVVSAKGTKLHIEPQNGWSEVYVHYWNKSNQNSTWPGEKATENKDGTFSFTIPAGYSGFLITNGKEGDKLSQTDDIKEFYLGIENHVTVYDKKYSSNGKDVYSYRVGMPYHTDIVYGENAEKEGFTFTPTDFMDSCYSIWMALTVFENKIDDEEGTSAQKKATALGNPINIGKEVQMYKKITVLPASVVYYEDDFAGIKYTTEGTQNVLTHYGDGSGSLSQSVDQNQEYGQDIAYQGSENDEATGGSLTDVLVKENAQIATFEFKGTGFEIIGHTHAVESGTVRVEVYDENGTRVTVKSVITEFDNGADGGDETIVAVPIIRISGLEFGKYKVVIKGVPVFDFDNWDKNTSKLPPAKKAYIYIDGVRIYQPLDNTGSKSKNLALGKDTDIKAYAGSAFTADVTDGKFVTTYKSGANEADWFAFKNTGDEITGNVNSDDRGVFTVDLGVKATIDTIRVHNYKGSGAGAFSYINLYTSMDGVTFNFITNGTINPDSSQTSAYWATFNLSTPVTAKYVKFAVGVDDYATVLINEVEVYGVEAVEAGKNDAYLETESGATFNEIRNLIVERQAFAVKYDDADGLSVSGGTNTWIENRNNALPGNIGAKWSNNTVNSINDYLLAGPNNEVYMIESTEREKSALVFYVTETNSNVHNMQIAVRAIDYGEYIAAENVGRVYAELQYGAMVDGQLVWKPLATTVSAAEQYFTVPYNECPYDAENNRYQVVIRVADTEITGMASYTTVKLNGLKLNTLNETEVPDIVYSNDGINSTIIDSNGNTIDTSKLVDFAGLVNQMKSDIVYAKNTNGAPAPEGVDTSALGALYHSFTADKSSDFVLTEQSKIYIVTDSEDTKPSAATIETAQLVQTQFMADSRPSSKALEIVWGLEKYSVSGDILIYANASNLGAEEYKLVVADKAKVYAADDNGLLYGLNTLQKHFRYAKANAIEGFTVEDYPQTAERTVHLDVARKYLTKDWIENYIKEMSWMGYNALELHFSEDGGFRADFWDPEYFVSENGNDFSWTVGSRTQYWVNDPYKTDPDAGSYLTAAELVEICETALEYNIEIIPSFDTPAHVDWLTWNYYNTYSSKGIYKSFNYNGTNYKLPTNINYRTTSTNDNRWAVLNLGDATVQKFAFAMYKDIADFFTKYAGSTKFNIGGDEVGLASDDTWNYRDFYLYINNLNALLNNEGYTVRMYSDFLGREKYINMLPSGTTMPDLAENIEIVFWTDQDPYNDQTYGLNTISSWDSESRKIYNGMNYWTYYVLRIADASSVSSANKGRDARDPKNTWWSFYRNQEDHIYNEWNPTLFSGYNASSKYTIGDDQLAGGYFMVWNDYAALNTEVEMWNGVYDRTGVSGTSNNYYSLIDRMWSNSIKQWNWGIHNSTYNGNAMTFARYESLRDKLGYFPGYVETASGRYANGCELPAPTEVSNEAYRTIYTVTFKNYDGTVINTQQVKEGFAATAPAEPVKPSDVWYDYTFTGWDNDFTNITADTVVTAQFSEKATTAGKIGYLGVKVAGGTNFTMSIDGSAAKPMGVEYANPSMEFGKAVTLTAQTTNSSTFVGWMDAKNGELLTTSTTYSFFTSGNDVFIAVYSTDITGGGLVTFKNDITNQVIDIQYYMAEDDILFPADLAYPGYEFTGWQYTEEQIKSMLAEGNDVTINAVWQVKDVYFEIVVNGGYVSESGGANGNSYVGYKGVTVKADPAEDEKFAYWMDAEGNVLSYSSEYKFYPYKDTELTAVYISRIGTDIDMVGTKPVTQKKTFTVYFENNCRWSDVSVYYWGVADSHEWPGVAMKKIGGKNGHELYSFEVPVGAEGFIINGLNGDNNRDQSPDLTNFVDGRLYRMNWNDGNDVQIDDSMIKTEGESLVYSVLYVYAPAGTLANGEWLAGYAYDTQSEETNNMWLSLESVGNGIYKALVPEKYSGLKVYKMTCQTGVFDTTGAQELLAGTISPDAQNTVVLKEGGGYKNFIEIYEMFFVNEHNWENIEIYYTDEYDTYKAVLKFVEKNVEGKDVYVMDIPANVTKIVFTNGVDSYTYTPVGKLASRTTFGFVPIIIDPEVEKDITVNVGTDAHSLGDSTVVVFDWSVLADTGYEFVNAGVLLVKEEDYNANTFVKGTIDPDVIQFVPAKKYQTSTGVHSVTITQVEVSDAWVACAFVQYRDEQGNLRTKYSKQVTGKK